MHLNKGNHAMKIYLDDGDAEEGVIGKKCVGLSIQVSKLKGNIERTPRDQRVVYQTPF